MLLDTWLCGRSFLRALLVQDKPIAYMKSIMLMWGPRTDVPCNLSKRLADYFSLDSIGADQYG